MHGEIAKSVFHFISRTYIAKLLISKIPVSLLCDVSLQQARGAFDAVTAHWYFKGRSSCTAGFSVHVG